MLKIKDNISLKTLEKYRIEPRYNAYTGKIEALVYEGHWVKSLFFKKRKRLFFWKPNKDFVLDSYRCFEEKECNFDLLYDLIKKGIIEKI